jgi:ArsR family transcriptional regulator
MCQDEPMPVPIPLLTEDLAGCCSPVTGGALDLIAAQRLARMFKALGDPTRVRLLSLIAAHPGGEACICDLTEPVGLSQPTVSHHMKQLADAGLVTRDQRGKWAFYRIVDSTLVTLSQALQPSSTAPSARASLVDGGVGQGVCLVCTRCRRVTAGLSESRFGDDLAESCRARWPGTRRSAIGLCAKACRPGAPQ